jgi:hypothetical protein
MTSKKRNPEIETKNPKVNKCVDTEKSAGSRVLLAQHPRPSLISGHDRRSADKIEKN